MTDKQIIINCIHNEEMGKPNAENALCLIDVDDKCCKDVEIRYCYYKQLKRKEQEYENLRGAMYKDRCSHYVLGECSQTHHDNCVGKNQCIKDLEQECKNLREDIKDIANLLGLDTDEEYNFGNIELEIKQLKAKEQECKQLREIMHKNRCSHYVLGECSQTHHDNCVDRNQCIKDLEQECKKLKEEIKTNGFGCFNIEMSEQLDQLKAENDKYSLLIEKLCDYVGLECDSEEQAMRTLSGLASQMNKARWIIDRLKQTLTEIKEIAEILAPMTDEYENCLDRDRCFECDFTEDCSYFNIKQILEKCEVINE